MSALHIHNPHARRWMMFVDGENLTIEGQKICKKRGIKLQSGPDFLNDVFLWFPGMSATQCLTNRGGHLTVEDHAIRSHYYTSVTGSDQKLAEVREALRSLGFHPEVFKKPQGRKSKGVDLTIARDMLSHAFRDNYDVALLITGDGDYAPLIEEIKRAGKVVYGAFFDGSMLSSRFRMSVDQFFSIDDFLEKSWTRKGDTDD